MERSLARAIAASFVALLLAISCSDSSQETGGGAGGAAAGAGPGRTGGAAGDPSGTGATDGGDGGTTDGGSSGGGTAGESGSVSQGGTNGNNPGAASDAGTDSGLDGRDASASAAADGEPCPNGDECGAGLICVGYGNPLPNGESTACRRVCSSESPPPDCICSGAGFCENSASGDEPVDAGAGGDAGLACGQLISNAGCADADGTTTDFESGEFQGCLHWRDLGVGQGWIYYETYGGFHYDLSTSLGWVVRTDTYVTQADAAEFCANFSVVGLSDWRLPTIDEARSLAGGCDNTAPGGSCPLSDSSCLDSSCGLGSACTSCQYGLGPNLPGNSYCRADVMLCNNFHTSSSCPDCSTPGDWRYNPGNGNFFASAADDAIFPVCVMENIPKAVPCRP